MQDATLRQGRKMTAYQQVVAAWNAQADETNRWDNLGEDEKIEWALKCADQFRGATKMIVDYDDCLNELGWDMNDFLAKNGAVFDGRVFNNMKGFLKVSIEKWLAAQAKQGDANG